MEAYVVPVMISFVMARPAALARRQPLHPLVATSLVGRVVGVGVIWAGTVGLLLIWVRLARGLPALMSGPVAGCLLLFVPDGDGHDGSAAWLCGKNRTVHYDGGVPDVLMVQVFCQSGSRGVLCRANASSRAMGGACGRWCFCVRGTMHSRLSA